MDGNLLVVDRDQGDHRSLRVKLQSLGPSLLAPRVAEPIDIPGRRIGPPANRADDDHEIGLRRRPLQLLDRVFERLVRTGHVQCVHPFARVFGEWSSLLRSGLTG